MKFIKSVTESVTTEIDLMQCESCGTLFYRTTVGGPHFHMSSPSQYYWELVKGEGCDICLPYEDEFFATDFSFTKPTEKTEYPTRWLTPNEIERCPSQSSVDCALWSEGRWYYACSDPQPDDPAGIEGAEFIQDEDGYYIPV